MRRPLALGVSETSLGRARATRAPSTLTWIGSRGADDHACAVWRSAMRPFTASSSQRGSLRRLWAARAPRRPPGATARAASACHRTALRSSVAVMSPPPKASNFPQKKLRKRPLQEGRGDAQRERCEGRAVVGLAVSRNPTHSSWLEGPMRLTGGCNDGSGGSRYGRGRAHARCSVTGSAAP